MRSWLTTLCGLLLVAALPGTAAQAGQGPDEGSMLVSGSISVDATGGVTGYALHDEQQIPAGVVRLIDQTIAGWSFQPWLQDGRAVPVQARMRLRVVAKPTGTGSYTLTVASEWFGTEGQAAGIKTTKRIPPQYPSRAIRQRVSGTAYVVAQLDATGKVKNAAVEQVNLHKVGQASDMRRWREMLGDASLTAVKRWNFDLSHAAPAASGRYVVRIPITYTLFPGVHSKAPPNIENRWISYIPGPVNAIAWLHNDEQLGADSLLPDAGIYLAGAQTLQLKKQGG